MKTEYVQILHSKTEHGWQPGLATKAYLHPADAAAINRHFPERGIVCVPKNEYEKYLKNSALLN